MFVLAVCQQNFGRRILHHERQTIRGVGGIQRYVRAAGFPDAQQRNHHFGRAFQTHAYQNVRPNTTLPKIIRHLVGALVQFPVGQSALFKNNGNGFRVQGHLLFEQLVHTALREFRTGSVPFVQNLSEFALGEHRQLSDALMLIEGDRCQKCFVMSAHALNGVGFENIRGILNRSLEAISDFREGQCQIISRCSCLRRPLPLRLDPCDGSSALLTANIT